MKKLFLISFFASLVGIFNLQAEGSEQYYSSYTGAGVNRLFVTSCLQTLYSTGTYSVYAIVASDFNIADANSIRLTANTGYTINIDLPTDRSAALTSTGLTFQMKKTADASLTNITLYIHKINKATIPYSLNFGSLYPYNNASPDFNGRGYRFLNNAATPQLASSSSTNSLFLAFNPSLSTDSLVCNYYASNNNTQTSLTATVSASVDGVSWTTLKTTNNDLPANSATVDQKRFALLLPVGTQYIQYLMTAKGSSDPAVNINVIYVKNKATTTDVIVSESLPKTLIFSFHNVVIVKNAKAYENIEIFNSVGTKVLLVNANAGENVLNLKTGGIYLVKVGNFVKKIVL